MDYLDFELEIGPGQGREYPVAVLRSPAGETRETLRFPFGELELQNKLQALQIALLRSGGVRRQALSLEQKTVQDFGRALFDALLPGEVRVRYDVSLRDAALQGRGLRFKLRVNTPDLAALPWEFLYDPRRAEYMCLSQDTPLVRYLELPQPLQPLTVTSPLRILGMVASPSDLGALDVSLEKQRVETALADLQAAGLASLTWLKGDTWRDLQQALRRGEWHVFHFIGHGDFDAAADEGLVMFCSEDDKSERMHATQLGRLLANHRSMRLALLNACEGAHGSARDLFSSTASILVRAGLPAVLAMQYAITDRAAIEFSRTFYESVADGLAVDAAVVEARVAMSLAVHNTVEWGTPVLFMRAPDGVLFRMRDAGGKNQESRIKNRESRIEHSAPSTQHPALSTQPSASDIPQPMTPIPEPSTGLPGALLRRLKETLSRCGEFESDRALRAVFVDMRLSLWRAQLPQETNAAGRIQAVIDYLYERSNAAGENGLVLLTQVLCDLTDPNDALYRQLSELATELEAVLKPAAGGQPVSRGVRESAVPEPPAVVADRVSPAVDQPPARRGGGKLEEELAGASKPPFVAPPAVAGSPFSVALQPFEPDLILIPAGEFWMGSDPKKDGSADKNEQPQHRLYLPDYAIAKAPTTNAQYAAFVQATGYETPGYWKNGKPPESKQDHPVVYVSWNDAVVYCKWLAEVTGKPYTLPSEAEWEKAARGTEGWLYPWGNEMPDHTRCNVGNSVKDTTPVGKYSPTGDSPYGCVDMAGNVWEWTRNLYKTYPYAPADGRESLQESGSRVLRGGAFYFVDGSARCACRSLSLPVYRGGYGFRVCVASSFSSPLSFHSG